MYSVTISEKGGNVTVRDFEQTEVSIGRIQGNDIVLPKSNISKRHARIIFNHGAFVVVDTKSTNGTYINGHRIDAPYDLKTGEKIIIGDYTLSLDASDAKEKSNAVPLPIPSEKSGSSRRKTGERDEDVLADDEWGADSDLEKEWEDDWDSPASRGTDAQDDEAEKFLNEALGEDDNKIKPGGKRRKSKTGVRRKSAKKTVDIRKGRRPSKRSSKIIAPTEDYARALMVVHERLLRSLDLRRLDVEKMDDDLLREQTRQAVQEIVATMKDEGALSDSVEPAVLIDNVLDEALGLGPLEDLIQDETVTEILVNRFDQVFIERMGKLEKTDRSFSSDQAILGVIERIVAPIGRRIDESSPMVDARLKDGSRVNAVIPPLSLKGPTLTIRKFTREPLEIDDLVVFGSLTADMAQFLEVCVSSRKNILICGGTGSGKTSTLNVLSGFIPEEERIITIEDAAELKLEQEHVVSLEARPPNIEGRGAITIRELVRNALRMRPDRIVVGECRGGEALDMLQAMNTGHEGSLTTVHANNPRDALSRLETMVLMSGMDLPIRAIRDQIANAINVIVHQVRMADGSRRITHISEITGMEADVISMQDIFIFTQEGFDDAGKVLGRHHPTGIIPLFYEKLKSIGFSTKLDIFQND